MLIVDEAQTLESERGHLLELLLIKLRALNPQIQVVFLSATLPNPRAIARWLDAALYLYAERMQRDPPSQRVTEYAVVNGEVRSRDGAILRRLGVSDRTGALRELVRELLAQADASTVLVFCPTKSRCEKVVRLLLPLMVSSPPPPHAQARAAGHPCALPVPVDGASLPQHPPPALSPHHASARHVAAKRFRQLLSSQLASQLRHLQSSHHALPDAGHGRPSQ